MTTEAFTPLPDMIRAHAAAAPEKIALIQDERQLSYGGLDSVMDRIAAALQREGLAARDSIAICAGTSIEYACAFLGALRAGMAVAPIAPSSTADSIVDMVADCGAKVFFLDRSVADALGDRLGAIKAKLVGLGDGALGVSYETFLAPEGAKSAAVTITEDMPFNIIYSSGTTGTSIVCVARCFCASSRYCAASNFFISTTAPPQPSAGKKLTKVVFE